MSLARRVMEQSIRFEQKRVTVEKIQDTVSEYYNVKKELIQSPPVTGDRAGTAGNHVFHQEAYGALPFANWSRGWATATTPRCCTLAILSRTTWMSTRVSGPISKRLSG